MTVSPARPNVHWPMPIWLAAALAVAIPIGLLPPRSGVAYAVGITCLAISLWRPSLGVAALILSVPVQDAWPAQLGQSLTWTRLGLACLLTTWLVNLALGRARIRMTPIAFALIGFCLALVASIAHARDTGAWAAETYRWGVAAITYVIAASAVRTARDRSAVLFALGVGVLFSFAVALYQVITRTGPETFNQRGLLRAYGLFGEPNPFAAYLVMASLPLIAVGLAGVRRPLRDGAWWSEILALCGGGIGVATLLLTQSRGGLLGFAAGLTVIVWALYPRGGRLLVSAGAAMAIALLWTPQAAGIRGTFGLSVLLGDGPRQVTPATFATEERLAHWGAAFRMWQSEPLLGIGAGNVAERFREFTPTWRFRISRGHAHNAYLQAAAQAGIVGLGWYLILIGTAWGRFRGAFSRGSSVEARVLHTAALSVTAAIAVHGVFEYVHVLSLGIVLSAVWALPERESDNA